MLTDDLRGLLARIDPDEVARVCADLVRLNTTNPPGNELQGCEYVARYLAPYEFATTILPYPGDATRGSVVCRLRGRGGSAGDAAAARALVFNGHLDVVPPGAQPWHYEPFAGTIAEGQVWGRGSSDMKGGVAAMLVAARALAEAGSALQGDLVVAATAGEEVAMQGAAQVAEWPGLGPVGGVIISEPTGNAIGLAERGVLRIELITHGQTAHSSTPHLGRNAINMMRGLLDALDRLAIPFRPHPVLGDFTYSINVIHGGTAHNVVPDRCTADLDMRTVPGQDHADILGRLQAMIDQVARAVPGMQAEVAAILDLPSVETRADDPFVRNFAMAAERVSGQPARFHTVRFATEAAIFVPALQVPVVICGPGDADQAHQPNEHVSIEALAQAARIYAAAAVHFSA